MTGAYADFWQRVYRRKPDTPKNASGPESLRHGEWTSSARVQKLGQTHAEKYLETLSLDKSKLKGIEATKVVLETRSAQDRAAYWQDIRLERRLGIAMLTEPSLCSSRCPLINGRGFWEIKLPLHNPLQRYCNRHRFGG